MNIGFSGYDKLGQSGLELMQKSMNTAGAAAERLASGGTDVADIAKTSMDMSEAKMQMAMGVYLVKAQEDLMDNALQLFDVGTRYKGTF